MLIALAPPQVIQIAGPDAITFAQAQFSSDVQNLADGHWHWSAWLSAQGRVRAFFHLLRLDKETLLMVLRGGSAESVHAALARYVFRAKVRLDISMGLSAQIIQSPREYTQIDLPARGPTIAADSAATIIALPGLSQRWLLLGPHDQSISDLDQIDIAEHHHALQANALVDIEAGIATLHPALEDRLLPDWIGLRDLAAASVGKGCYPGQEIVARMHFKGGNKRWLHRIEFDADALPAPGTPILSSEANVEPRGLIVDSARSSAATVVALAVLREGEVSDSPVLKVDASEIRSTLKIHPSAY